MKIVIICSIFLIGCASSVFESRTDFVGEYTKKKIRHQPSKVEPKVFINTYPDGFYNTKQGIEYDTSTYLYIGKIRIDRCAGNIGFYNFNEPWRKFYCPVAVTLTYASLFTLAITPIPYFCKYETDNSNNRIEERKENIINALIIEGKRIGATHIINTNYLNYNYQGSSTSIVPVGNMVLSNTSSHRYSYLFVGMEADAFKIK